MYTELSKIIEHGLKGNKLAVREYCELLFLKSIDHETDIKIILEKHLFNKKSNKVELDNEDSVCFCHYGEVKLDKGIGTLPIDGRMPNGDIFITTSDKKTTCIRPIGNMFAVATDDPIVEVFFEYEFKKKVGKGKWI